MEVRGSELIKLFYIMKEVFNRKFKGLVKVSISNNLELSINEIKRTRKKGISFYFKKKVDNNIFIVYVNSEYQILKENIEKIKNRIKGDSLRKELYNYDRDFTDIIVKDNNKELSYRIMEKSISIFNKSGKLDKLILFNDYDNLNNFICDILTQFIFSIFYNKDNNEVIRNSFNELANSLINKIKGYEDANKR